MTLPHILDFPTLQTTVPPPVRQEEKATWQKRLTIERGQTVSWARRKRRAFHLAMQHGAIPLLRSSLRALGLLHTGRQNALTLQLSRLQFSFDTLPEAFCGLRILHLSDLHIDGVPGLPEQIVRSVESLDIDLCVLTGDYRFSISGPCDGIYPAMEKMLTGIQPRLGTFGILGNHDAAEEVAGLERLGIKMLVNDKIEIREGTDSLWLLGLDDPHYYGCDDLPGTLRGVPQDDFKLLLVHTPEIIREASESGVNLYLCGHTHGGQVCLPFIGPLLLNADCERRYTRGRWQHHNLQGYTSAGVGSSGLPVRFFCPPEIGLIELRCSRHRSSRSSSA